MLEGSKRLRSQDLYGMNEISFAMKITGNDNSFNRNVQDGLGGIAEMPRFASVKISEQNLCGR